MLSNSQVDALGDRLRQQLPVDGDANLLDEYRLTFLPAFERTMSLCRQLDLKPTGRFGKSTRSIVAKLQRESVRLSQVQDIAGCRIVLPGAPKATDRSIQDEHVQRIVNELSKAGIPYKVYDRRERPSHGYRAVHVVALVEDKPVEVQVRTNWQHQFAQVVELVADQVGNDIKYGGGDRYLRDSVDRLSDIVKNIEVPVDQSDEEGSTPLGGLFRDLGKVINFVGETYHLSRLLEVMGAQQIDLLSRL